MLKCFENIEKRKKIIGMGVDSATRLILADYSLVKELQLEDQNSLRTFLTMGETAL